MPQVIHIKDITSVPWKNGSGSTIELYRQPFAGHEFGLRLSIASVKQDGLFSIFQNIERTLLLLDGKGIELTINDKQKIKLKDKFKPIAFSGNDLIQSKLIEGPVTDFNLMVHRDYGVGKIKVHNLKPNEKNNFKNDEQQFLYFVSGNFTSQDKVYNEGSLFIINKNEVCEIVAITPVTLIEVTISHFSDHTIKI